MAQKGAWAVKQMQLESELASSGALQGMQVVKGRDCFCTETLPIISPHLIGPYVYAYTRICLYKYSFTHVHTLLLFRSLPQLLSRRDIYIFTCTRIHCIDTDVIAPKEIVQ